MEHEGLIFGGLILWLLALTIINYFDKVGIRMLEGRIDNLKDKYVTPEQLDCWWYGDHDKWNYRGPGDRSGNLKAAMACIEMLAKHQGVRFSFTVPQKSEMILVPVSEEVRAQ